MTARPQRSLRTGELHALGVTRGELAGPRWRAPFHGVRSPAVGDSGSPLQRLLDVAEIVPAGGAIGGWGAAHLLGATELDGRGRSGRERQDVMVLAPRPHHQAYRPGVRFLRSRLDEGDVVEVRGIRVTARLRTAFDLARASTVENGMVAADVLCRVLGLEPASVMLYLEEHPRFRGVPVARRALALADPRSRSVGESRLRYVWVVEAGLPRPQCNPYVVDAAGGVVAMPDLLDDGSGLAGEYDGATHRQLMDHTHDNSREEDLENLGLVVVRATSLDLGALRPRTVTRLRTGWGRAAATPRPRWGWLPGPRPPVTARPLPAPAPEW